MPPLPDDLRERIQEQYGKALTSARPAAGPQAESVFAKLARLFAQPAIRGAAAAIMLLAVAAIFLLPSGKDAPSDVPRGGQTYTGVTIVLFGFEADQSAALAKEFDPKAVKIVANLSGQIAAEGRTIVINAVDKRIEGYVGAGSTPQFLPLPESPADIAAEAAKLSVQLKK